MPNLLRLPEVIKKTGLSRSTIYQKMHDRTFPAAIQIGARAVAWLEADIDNWIEEIIRRTRTKRPKLADLLKQRDASGEHP